MAPKPPHDPYDNKIPTAPADVIGDDGDLRTMRTALREGRVATLASDGHVYVGHEAREPMTPEAEAVIEAKMGHVIEMARHGFGITIHPDGRIAGSSQDQNVKVIFEPTSGVSQDQRNLISSGISDGAQVTIAPDGMVMYNKAPGAQPPTGEVALEMNKFLDAEIASGNLQAAQSAGQGLNLDVPNAAHGYITPAAAPPAVEFPEDRHVDLPPPGTEPGEPTTPPDDTTPPDSTTPPVLQDPAEELLARAEQVERDAATARSASLDTYEAEVGAAKISMQQAERSLAGATAIATTAAVQADTADAAVASIRAEYEQYVAKSPGNDENAEYAQSLQHGIAVAEQRAEEARRAAQIAEADADSAKARYDELDHDRQAAIDKANETETFLDANEEIALVMRVGSEQLREAARLDTAADEFEARGDADGAARIRAAADEQRAGAEHTEWEVTQLQAGVTPPSPGPVTHPDGTIDPKTTPATDSVEPGAHVDVLGVDTAPGGDVANPRPQSDTQRETEFESGLQPQTGPLADPSVEARQFEEFLEDEQREAPPAASVDTPREDPRSPEPDFEESLRDASLPEAVQEEAFQEEAFQEEAFEQPTLDEATLEAPVFEEPITEYEAGYESDFAEGNALVDASVDPVITDYDS